MLRLQNVYGPRQSLSNPYTGIVSLFSRLGREVAAYHSAPESHVTGQYRDGGVRHASCTVDDTVTDLDWQARVSLATVSPGCRGGSRPSWTEACRPGRDPALPGAPG